eukprot:1179203-Prorocentrum_minimum.AAC.2
MQTTLKPTPNLCAPLTRLAIRNKGVLRGSTGGPEGVQMRAAGGAGGGYVPAREAATFPFLTPQHRRDGKGRRPDHPDFDHTTVMLPKDFPVIKMANGEKKTISGAATPLTPHLRYCATVLLCHCATVPLRHAMRLLMGVFARGAP